MTFIRYLIFATYKVQELRTNTHSLIESSQIYHEMTNILLFYRKHKERSTWSCGFTVRKCKSGFALGFTLYTVSDYFSWLTLPKYSLKGVIFCFILYLVVSCLRLGFFLFMWQSLNLYIFSFVYSVSLQILILGRLYEQQFISLRVIILAKQWGHWYLTHAYSMQWSKCSLSLPTYTAMHHFQPLLTTIIHSAWTESPRM